MIVGTSWKMNKTRPEAQAWVAEVCAGLPPLGADDQVFVIPPFTAIAPAKEAAANTPLLVGAQNVHEADAGAFTGEISAAMLRELGCDIVELGHSERRTLFNESDLAIAAKVHQVLTAGMRPLICVGEDAPTREAGKATDYVLSQAHAVFAHVQPNELADCWLAYEPVWAIGSGSTPATPAQIAPVHAALRDNFPTIPLLYGGSVAIDNAAALVATPAVDGLFVGRAALAAQGFLTILNASLSTTSS